MFILVMLMIMANGQQLAIYPGVFASQELCQASLDATVTKMKIEPRVSMVELKCFQW